MPNFELKFDTVFYDPLEGGQPKKSKEYIRIISAEDRKTKNHQELARRIGVEMAREEVNIHEFLNALKSVIPTDKPVTENYWDNIRSWTWVPYGLNLKEEDFEVVRNENGLKVGLIVK